MKSIKELEEKGYIVMATENKWMGKVDEECPVVYNILNPDYTSVYGANGIAPEDLSSWNETLPDLTEKIKMTSAVTLDTKGAATKKQKEIEFDNLYNEGSEGYNPYKS